VCDGIVRVKEWTRFSCSRCGAGDSHDWFSDGAIRFARFQLCSALSAVSLLNFVNLSASAGSDLVGIRIWPHVILACRKPISGCHFASGHYRPGVLLRDSLVRVGVSISWILF